MHVPADAPPQPLRYCPAMHDEAEHAEQEDAPALGVRDRTGNLNTLCLSSTLRSAPKKAKSLESEANLTT